MASHMIDQFFFNHIVSNEEMRNLFEEDNAVQNLLDVEAALARAEAKLGMIPQYAADEICKKAKLEYLDRNKIKADILRLEHSLMPFIKAVQSICEGDAGEFIHFGATTQDIRDTAMALNIKKAREIIYKDLNEMCKVLADMSIKHKDTAMAGRTHGQQALPITFGYKAAVWLDEMQRHVERLEETKDRLLVGNMNGGVGTFASFGESGPEVERLVMEDLGLNVPNICWQASRDRFAEFLSILAMIASTCSKISNEIYNMQATEVNEVAEGFKKGQLGSSTMPHKRNPETCESVMSIAKIARSNANVMLQVMETEHERDGSMWRTEWILIPETCIYTSYVLRLCMGILERLDVKQENMLKNLNILNGLIISEKVMFAISDKLGKQTAHTIVYETSMRAYEENRKLSEVIAEDPRTRDVFTKEEIDELLDPTKYVGLSAEITKSVVKAWNDRAVKER